LVSTFGDVPYYDREIGSAELDELYKPRTPRNEVMDAIYDDFVFALENVRGDLGSKLDVNTYVVAGIASRWALFEGTWQKYHENNAARSQKFLELAVRAAEVVMNSGRFSFNTDFRSLFGSQTLAGVGEVILFRRYDDAQSTTHSQASLNNMVESQSTAPNLALIKSFICNDGSDWQTSENELNKSFSIADLIKTRDSRFEASFYKATTYKSIPSCLYIAKFINREGHRWVDAGLAGPPTQYISTNNTNAYPVLRYAEVVLNWIEAKAELGNVIQADIDRSINAIRNRPLAADAIAAGVQRTAPLSLANLPVSPDRGEISQLLWEIRRERRMEFVGEFSRLHDLRRWKKLDYMEADLNPDILIGTWVKLSEIRDLPSNWSTVHRDLMGVMDMDGKKTLFDGTNTNIEGFYYRVNVQKRLPFLDLFNVNPYLSPVGRNQRIAYQDKGYYLAQTKGWPEEI
ncbi:MAG: RagB/SusD family nutrient uptake outer membrane protein, partial [Bacteroidales bacterium]|nr:RagB/SusD family nutrient uptake outer membrane protein [Bacteroidales bacterium]